jgi:hypothetical protein
MSALDLAVLQRRPVTIPRAAIASYRMRFELAAVVGISFVLRCLAALGHTTPRYFPDEYIYASLAKSLAHGQGLQIRGGAAHFPALLEPILSAPFWLVGGTETSFRLTLFWHSLAMSLAAIPVYLLCRRLQASHRIGLAAAVVSVTLPSLIWASYLTADAIAYPLALGAVCAMVAALDRPSVRLQALVLGLSGAATFARVQYVVLPVVFVIAAIVLERGKVRTIVSRYRFSLVLLALPFAAAAATGPSKVLGYYSAVTGLSLDPGALARWGSVDAALLAFAAGIVLVPVAVTGIVASLVRPLGRAEAAFGLVVTLFAGALLFEAALYASNGSERFQERYLIVLPALIAPAFALGLRRAGSWFLVATATAAAIVLFGARVPMSGYTFGTGKQDSSFLSAISQLEGWIGSSSASLVVAVAAAALAALGVGAMRSRRAAALALTAAVLVTAGLSVAATANDHATSTRARVTYAPGDRQWVDHAGVGSADLLALAYTPRAIAPIHLFWNSFLRDVLVMPLAPPPDAFRLYQSRVAGDGTLLKNGRPTRRPVLVEEYLGRASFQHAEKVSSTLMGALWKPHGDLQLSWLVRGRYFDGWLASKSSITVWPDASRRVDGSLRLSLYLSTQNNASSVKLSAPGYKKTIDVAPGQRIDLRIPVHSTRAWTLDLAAPGLRFLADGRTVSVQSLPPTFERTSGLKASAATADRS